MSAGTPSLRHDVTADEWVIISPGRARRPSRPTPAGREPQPEHDPDCPFCPGNEDRTPPEILRTIGPDGGWEQRVVPNLYPALDPALRSDGAGGPPEMPGGGAHEVVVETPRHDERIDVMTVPRVAGFLRVWRDRYVSLEREPGIEAVSVFKNFGEGAGISLPHPHSQIVAMPVTPPAWRRRHRVARRYHEETGRCIYERLRDAELHRGDRVVAQGDRFVALVPFAARAPYETWILPRARQPWFGAVPDGALAELGELLRDVLRGLRAAAGDPDFNLLVRSAPFPEGEDPSFLWHLQLVPRKETPAGFELSTGMSINTVAPEEAARGLRAALAEAR